MPATTQRQLSLPIDATEETPKQRRARKITEILTEAREPAAPIDQVLSTRQVVEITGKHRVTIYRWIRAGIFPEKHESRGHKVGWLRSEIEAWLQRSPPAS